MIHFRVKYKNSLPLSVMKKQKNLLQHLDPNLFWDVDMHQLNPEKSRRLIIERVFTLGKASEIREIINYYGSAEVKHILKNLNYMDQKTLNFVSKLFNIPLNEFRCYTRKQLKDQHWNS